MRSRLWIVIALIVLFTAPALFACEECRNTTTCITGLQTGFFCQFLIGGGCINDGACPDPGWGPLQAQWRVASVRVIDPAGKPLPKAQPKPAPLLAAAK